MAGIQKDWRWKTMAADTKTKSPFDEVAGLYEGVLSRDWPVLIAALNRGEIRACIYLHAWFTDEKDADGNKARREMEPVTRLDFFICRFGRAGNPEIYDLGATVFADWGMEKVVGWLEKTCLGFFPTKGDME